MTRRRSSCIAADHLPIRRQYARTFMLPRVLAVSFVAILSAPAEVGAQIVQAPATTPITRNYNIPAGPLSDALTRFSSEAGIYLVGSMELAQNKRSPGVKGTYSVQSALSALMTGTGLRVETISPGRYVLRRAPAVINTPGKKDPNVVMLGAISAQSGINSSLPESYAGGQVARGGRVGVLGNKDFMEVPFNVTSYTSQNIENTQARSLADVVASNDPSVRTVGGVGSFGEGFTIRGLGFESGEVSFNGIPGIAPVWRFMPEFLERIEVLKGPNAFLNGSTTFGSVGGAITVVPKRATDAPVSKVTANYESDSIGGGNVDIGRRFGKDNEFGIRINGTYRNGEHARDHLKERSRQFALGLDYRSERLRLELDAMIQKQTTHGGQWGTPALASTITQVPSVPSNKRNWNQPWERADVEEKILATRAEYDISDNLTIYGAAGLNKSDQYYVTSRGTIEDDAGTMTQAFRTHVTPYETKTVDLGMRGRFLTGSVSHEWNVGYTYIRNETGSKVGTVMPNTLISNLYDPVEAPYPIDIDMPDSAPMTSQRRLSSVAISDTLGFADDSVLLTLGLRRQQVQIRSFDGTTGAETANYDQFALTPVVGVLWKLSPITSVYANYIEGLTPGDTAPVGSINAGEVFSPYKSKQIEAGVKFDLQSFAVTTSIFQIRKASGGLDPTTLEYSVNGQQRNTGAELNIFGEPWRGLRVLGGVAYIDAKLARTSDGGDEGNIAPNQPKLRANLFVEKDIDPVPGLALNAGMVYTGSQYLNNANTLKIPAWTRFDVGARYTTRIQGHSVTFRANVRNVLDKNYWSQNLYAGDPRTFLLSATMEF